MDARQTHTPTPWRVEQDTTLIWGACDQDDLSDRGMGYPVAECRITPISLGWAKGPNADEGVANAAFIVKAVNSHEALVAALTASLVAMKIASALPLVSAEYDFGPAIAEVTAALKATGG